jgi:hypothetical protein
MKRLILTLQAGNDWAERKEFKMFHNVVVGKPLISASNLIALDDKDWESNEKELTLFTETRFLPAIMKEAGIVKSTAEVKRNKPELCITLDKLDCFNLKWGKRFLFIIVGE